MNAVVGSSSNILALFQQQGAVALPEYLKSNPAIKSALAGGMGDGRNRIGLKGARFRLVEGGQEVAVINDTFLDVHVIAANGAISRSFYAGKYKEGSKDKPACFSVDGIVPAKDSPTPQHTACGQCPQNVKGSRINDDGSKGRACGFAKRLVVGLLGQTPMKAYQLDIKSMSIFGDGKPAQGLYSLQEYAKLLAAQNVRAEGVVTRLTFDTASSVPKLYFTPQAFAAPEVVAQIDKLAADPMVQSMIEVNLATMDLSGELDAAPAAPTTAVNPTPPVFTVPINVAPVAPPAPVVAPAPVVPAAPPGFTYDAATNSFMPIPVAPAVPAAPPGFRFDAATNSYVPDAPVAPVVAVIPPPTPVAVAAAAAGPAATQAAVATTQSFSPSSDDELKKLLSNLNV